MFIFVRDTATVVRAWRYEDNFWEPHSLLLCEAHELNSEHQA